MSSLGEQGLDVAHTTARTPQQLIDVGQCDLRTSQSLLGRVLQRLYNGDAQASTGCVLVPSPTIPA
jgi:hypothetical protein